MSFMEGLMRAAWMGLEVRGTLDAIDHYASPQGGSIRSWIVLLLNLLQEHCRSWLRKTKAAMLVLKDVRQLAILPRYS